MRNKQDKHAKQLKESALKAAKKLDEACTAMNAFMSACFQAGHPDNRGLADSRRRLVEDMSEYSTHLEAVYDK